MGIKKIVFSVFFLFTLYHCAGKDFYVAESLRPQWKVFTDDKLNPFDESGYKAIHISLDLAQAKGRFLQIESYDTFYLFINNKFVIQSKRLILNPDSLKQIYDNAIFISLYQPKGINSLETNWVSLFRNDSLYNPKRPSQSFSNFILVATLVLLVFFTGLYQTNPQLTLDYLDFTKLFFLRDREESQIVLRITSSVNLLFYLFCSLLTSLALVTAAHYSNQGLSFLARSATLTTGQEIGQWLILALSILGLLMAKLAFVTLLALLYDWRDVAGFQYFNFVRVLLISLAILALVSIFCFSFSINLNYFNLLKTGSVLLAAGLGLLFLKLLTSTSFRSFHLFTYLCASEIFPLVILIKVILF